MRRNYSKALLAAAAFAGMGLQQAWADKIETSTADSPKWFRIYTPNRNNLSIISKGVGVAMQNTTTFEKPYSASQLWRLEAGGTDGTYKIVNMAGEYISPSSTVAVGNNTSFAPVKSGAGDWTITDLGDDTYTIASGSVQFNTSQDAPNYYLYNWGGGSNKVDTGCKYSFAAVSITDLEQAQAKALSVLNETEEGTNPGQYPTEARSTFTNAVNAATTTDAVTAAQTAYEAAMVKVQAGKTYYIMSDKSTSYCQGKYIYSAGNGAQPMWGNKMVSAAYGWTFTDAGEGKFYVQNYGTKEYIEPNSTNTSGATKTVATPATKYTVTSLGQGVFNITPDGKNPLHAQQANSVLVMWAGGIGSASAWRLVEIPEADLNAAPSLSTVNVQPGTQTYAPGQEGQVLLTFATNVSGFNGSVQGKGLKLNLGATTPASLQNIQVYTSENADFVSNGNRKATLVGKAATVTGNEVEVTFDNSVEMPSGDTRFYVTADITDKAVVGDSVDVSLTAFVAADSTYTITNGNPEGFARIYKVQSAPYQPYDLGSHYWRIPAMVILKHQTDASKNGRVVTMADNRFNHNSDLPSHIDVYERHSDDNGKTWSDHKMVVGTEADEALVASTDGNSHKGFGDVALVETSKGRIIAMMVGGQGYFYSSEVKGNRNVPTIITSDDGGDTWSAPRTLDDQMYSTTFTEGQVKGSFAGSGRGLLLQRQKDASRNGRVMFAMSHRFVVNGSNSIQEYIIYSDDEGVTWKFSTQSAYSGGDESKLVETANGDVIISVRQSGQRGYNISTDGGVTWGKQAKWADINGNACNGDILYVNKHVMLHSYPNNGSRKNVTIKASFDQGKTWSNPYVVCAPNSCYSTMDVTKDGDIAIFYEDNACSTGFVLNYAVLPTSFIYEGDLSQMALDAALASAKKVTDASCYETITEATAGQVEKAHYDAVATLVDKASATGLTDDQKDELAAEIETAASAALSTICTVDGYYNGTTFTISSLENIDGTAPKYIAADATAVDSNDCEWRMAPAATIGQVYIQQKGADNYLTRSGSTLTVAAAPQAWTLVKGDGDYYHIQSTVSNNTYLAINMTGGAFNYINQKNNYNTWSTKFVLTAKTVVTGINNATVVNDNEQPVRYYDLQGRRVLKPAKGLFITSTGKKVIK